MYIHFLILCVRRYGPIYLDFSPHYVMYSGWVGDDDPTFEGLEYALKCYLQSAWASESHVCNTVFSTEINVNYVLEMSCATLHFSHRLRQFWL